MRLPSSRKAGLQQAGIVECGIEFRIPKQILNPNINSKRFSSSHFFGNACSFRISPRFHRKGIRVWNSKSPYLPISLSPYFPIAVSLVSLLPRHRVILPCIVPIEIDLEE
jgi:hypothetical protein